MCYSRDYRVLADQQKQEDAQRRRERRAGVLDTMLTDANKEAEKARQATQIEDVAPAK